MRSESAPVKTKDLVIGYGKTEVLSEINLCARSGHLTTLLGANGTGKSTLLRTLAGLQRQLAGEIWLNQKISSDLAPLEKATMVSLVLTDRVFPGYMTVGDLVALGRHPYTNWRGRLNEDDLKSTKEALDMTGLGDIKDKDLHQLSDGQLQKALIARALAQDGTIMLLDEPLIHLDIPSKWEIMGLLKRMSDEKQKTIILATHELELSLQMADQIWLINRNNNLICGEPEELVSNGSIADAFNTAHYQFR